uniref:Uncharacterized protein n=1 Tax=Cannabis sativa TaxID=3483 RepID=A0A803QYC7_CANSA
MGNHLKTTMILVHHPNVKSHCSFVNGQFLWVVMPFMARGSCLHILKVAHPNGFDEVVIVYTSSWPHA